MAQHQWANEGCTAVHNRNDTIGSPVNEAGGGGEHDQYSIQVSRSFNIAQGSNKYLIIYPSLRVGMGSGKPLHQIMGLQSARGYAPKSYSSHGDGKSKRN